MRAGTMVLHVPADMKQTEVDHWEKEMRKRFEAAQLRRSLQGDGKLAQRADDLNRQYFGSVREISEIKYVTNQGTLYGSCTFETATIRISAVVADYPAWVRDYILVHEIAHLYVASHGPDFWALVNRYPLTERARGFLIAKGMSDD